LSNEGAAIRELAELAVEGASNSFPKIHGLFLGKKGELSGLKVKLYEAGKVI